MTGNPKVIFNLKSLQYILVCGLLLYFGRSFFIPISVSLLISFVLYPVCIWLERHRFNRGAAISLSISLLVLGGLGLGYLFFRQIIDFSSEWPQLEKKLVQSLLQLSDYISGNFSIKSEEQVVILKDALKKSSFQILGFFPQVVYSSGVLLVMAILIPIISALMLFHRARLVKVLSAFFPEGEIQKVRNVLSLSVANYYNFIKGMLIVYFTVGLLNSIGLFFLGIPYSFLFGYIAAVMTFIPYAGIIISSLLPITIAWVTYDSVWYPIGVVAIFTVVQYLEANVIFPLAVSSRLKVNTLVTLAAILIGGIIWGAAGMILFIPYLGIIKVIADQTEVLAPLAMLLDSKEISPEN
jgi:predicted PurR-regulated permease PerM